MHLPQLCYSEDRPFLAFSTLMLQCFLCVQCLKTWEGLGTRLPIVRLHKV
jgi:hypothetical protein